MPLITEKLLDIIKQEYQLEWNGLHGINHWQRVRENGLKLSQTTGADRTIVELFAFLHDIKRQDDGYDLEHGERAADYLTANRNIIPPLSDDDFKLLCYAISFHSRGKTGGNVTVKTCWDADRLDLGRIGVMPSPRYLCTDAAKDPKIIKWAYKRSRQG